MPSSPWSSRLLNSNATNEQSDSKPFIHPRDKALPRLPVNTFEEPPTLHLQRPTPTSSSRPTSSGSREHAHNRSVSHPLPRIFGKKKSPRGFGFNDDNVPIDDDLVPVLKEQDNERRLPKRNITGRRGKQDGNDKVTRRCMCCDSKVSVPQEVEKFRCLACLTVNDLTTPVDNAKASENKAEASQLANAAVSDDVESLSLSRTRAIVDQCLIRYLENWVRNKCDARNTSRDPASTIEPSSRPRQQLHRREPSSGIPVEMTQPLIPVPRVQQRLRGFSQHQAHSLEPTPSFGGNESPEIRSRSRPREHFPNLPPSRPPPPVPSSLPSLPSLEDENKGRHYSPSNSPSKSAGRPLPERLHSIERIEISRYDILKKIFRPLEDYIVGHFGSCESLNLSFISHGSPSQSRTKSEGQLQTSSVRSNLESAQNQKDQTFEIEEKLLLLGDLGENSSWWSDHVGTTGFDHSSRGKRTITEDYKLVSSKSPNINFTDVRHWYHLIHTANRDWQRCIQRLNLNATFLPKECFEDPSNVVDIDSDLETARDHVVRTLLKVTENLLKRPGQPLRQPEDIRFLLILLENPSLSPKQTMAPSKSSDQRSLEHTGLLKRIFGLVANSSDTSHRCLINWFLRYDDSRFVRIVDLVAAFVNYRLTREASTKPANASASIDGGLIPYFSGSAMSTSAQLHSALGLGGAKSQKTGAADTETQWANDWQLKAVAKVMSLLFAANNNWQKTSSTSAMSGPRGADLVLSRTTLSADSRDTKQLLPTSSFYNSLLDYRDMIADFRVWETKKDKFAFCQYPLFLSMGTKIKILEYDARRQMEVKAREAYFDQIIQQRAIDGYFHLRVRRDCLVDDSLRQISAAVGAGPEELKKGLRVQFAGEEGVDAGGLRKEWFSILVRDIFDPNHGMFVYDEDSHMCYFNSQSFETSDQYYLVGALLGLAIYNSTILDIPFPPFAFRKLLAAAPNPIGTNTSGLASTKPQMTYTLAELSQLRPSLAAGLQQLLDYDGDVATTFCRDFVASMDKYGSTADIPLIPNGEKIPVTNANRREFVDAYVRWALDTSVSKQFEPFKRGFFTVCAGNALSLFRPEEIELLVRGSDEPLDVNSLKAVAIYDNWKCRDEPHVAHINPAETVPVIQWFWDLLLDATPVQQRKLLGFVTGSDRIPAVGATSLVLRIVAGGDGWGGGGASERERFPVARTCFNTLVLWHYETPMQLEQKLWRAVNESEGFGLK